MKINVMKISGSALFFGTVATFVMVLLFIGVGPSDRYNSVYIMDRDIHDYINCDEGYDVYGILNADFTINTIERKPSENEIEIFLQKIEFCKAIDKKVLQEKDIIDLSNLWFVGFEPDENEKTLEYDPFYIFFFDDFSKAISNASAEMDKFDISNPEKRMLNEYYYTIENSEIVKEFFIDKGLYN